MSVRKVIAVGWADGLRLAVVDNIHLLTPYVMVEQRDWFEADIKFLRRVARPGDCVVDIGANHGVYSIDLAKRILPDGHVWAFEPSSETADLFRQSVSMNGLNNVTIEQSALSSEVGEARFLMKPESELNALARDVPSGVPTEVVAVVTLDDCLRRYDWAGIDLVKIDTEGEEANVIRGGAKFFARFSPLVMFEYSHSNLIEQFGQLGYTTYRLVPGLQTLVPLDSSRTRPDAYVTNVYCCKPDRAKRLQGRGLLVDQSQSGSPTAIPHGQTDSLRSWLAAAGTFPYVLALGESWARSEKGGGWPPGLGDALAEFQSSQDSAIHMENRFAALKRSFGRLQRICESQSGSIQRMSLARVAIELGERALAKEMLEGVLADYQKSGQLDLSEPFLAPEGRFDGVPPRNSIQEWALAAVLESYERAAHHSSFFTGDGGRARLEAIRDLGYGSEEMSRRLQLLRMRFPDPH